MKERESNIETLFNDLVSLPDKKQPFIIFTGQKHQAFSKIAPEVTEEWEWAKQLAKDYEFEDLNFSIKRYREVFLKEKEAEIESEIQKLDLILMGLALAYIFVMAGFYPLVIGLLLIVMLGIRFIISARLKSALVYYKNKLEILEKARYLAARKLSNN